MPASLTLSADLTAGAISAIRRSYGRLFSTANHNFSRENIELPVTPSTVNPLYRFYRASVDWFLRRCLLRVPESAPTSFRESHLKATGKELIVGCRFKFA
jgi:hypothetical protein